MRRFLRGGQPYKENQLFELEQQTKKWEELLLKQSKEIKFLIGKPLLEAKNGLCE